jgi:hypothetical protein
MGVMALIGSALFLSFLKMSSHANVLIGACLAVFSIPCFLGRFNLTLDVQAGRVSDTSGFWPFAKDRSALVVDFSGLEIVYVPGGKSGHYTLWLIAKEGRRISLGDSSTLPKLNNLAHELSGVTGWTVSDLTDGRNSLASLFN